MTKINYSSGSQLLLAEKLKARELSEETLMEIEALGFRAIQTGQKELEDAVGKVICALQGNWGMNNSEIKSQPEVPA